MMHLIFATLFATAYFGPAAVQQDPGERGLANDEQVVAGVDDVEAVERVRRATEVLHQIMAVPEEGIPRDLLAGAHCVAIVPGVIRGAFIFGAQYGKGLMTCRAGEAGDWTGPSTIRVEGGSIGFQIGGSEIDLVMLVMNEEGADRLMESRFRLGTDATVAGGPVGRSVGADTDALFRAQILTYSRARGAFAGVALEGGTVRPDDRDNRALYGRDVEHREILTGVVSAPRQAQELIDALKMYGGAASSPAREPAAAPRRDDPGRTEDPGIDNR